MIPQHDPPVIVRVGYMIQSEKCRAILRLHTVNPNFVPGEVAVSEEKDGAACPDAQGVHVVPVFPVGGEPPEPHLSLRNDQPPASGTVVAVVADSAG